MNTCTTHGIKINVRSRYEQGHSNASEKRFVFSYLIEIINESEFTVQLLRRHWTIIDSNCSKREVEGDGVVGQQPILHPGESHTYTSWCPFNSEIGMMKGYFTMQKAISDEMIKVNVPPFTMSTVSKLN